MMSDKKWICYNNVERKRSWSKDNQLSRTVSKKYNDLYLVGVESEPSTIILFWKTKQSIRTSTVSIRPTKYSNQRKSSKVI